MIANKKITIGWTWPWCRYSDFAEIPPFSHWMEGCPLKCCAQWIGMVLFKETKTIFLCKYLFFCFGFCFLLNFYFKFPAALILIRINHYFWSFPFSPWAWWISVVGWSLELLWAVMLSHISPIPLEPTLLILSPNLNL